MRASDSFAAFRYFIVPNEQISLFDTVEEKRNEAVTSLFEKITTEHKLTYELKGHKHILVFNRKIAKDVFLCKFSKEENITLFLEGELDIENVVNTNLPFVYLVFDIKRQIILIQLKTSVFKSVEATKNKLEKCMEIEFVRYGFTVKIDEITDEANFWTFVDNSDGVIEIELELNSPNLFGGHANINEMLKLINNEYNNTQTTFKVKNEKGKLSLKKLNESLQSALKYISGGAGRWKMKYLKDGQQKKAESKHNIKKISIVKIDENESNDVNKDLLEAILSVETILIDKKDDEK